MSSKKSKRADSELPPQIEVVTADESEWPDDVACSDLGWHRGGSDRVATRTAHDWEMSLRGFAYDADYPTPDMSGTPDPSLPRFAAVPDWNPEELLFDAPPVFRRANESKRVC
jgi:hypothetical protein